MTPAVATWQRDIVSDEQAEDLSTFGGRLDAAMKSAGVKALQLKRTTGIDDGYIGRLVRGQRKMPSGDIVDKLAAALDVATTWLTNGKGERDRSAQGTEQSTLDAVLEETEWRFIDLTPEQAQVVVAALRDEHFKATTQMPRSYWRDRRDTLAIEARRGATKKVPRPEHDESADARDAREQREERERRAAAKAKTKAKKRTP